MSRYEWKETRGIEISDIYTKEEGDQQKLQVLPNPEKEEESGDENSSN